MRVDLHVELHDVKNRGPADSPPCLARLAQISFNWRDPSSKMSKVVASRDTKLDSGRESTNSNLFLFQSSSEKELRRLYLLKLDNHRISLDRKSRQAFLDHETFTKGHRFDFHSGKTAGQPIPSRKSEESPRSASSGESPLEERG